MVHELQSYIVTHVWTSGACCSNTDLLTSVHVTLLMTSFPPVPWGKWQTFLFFFINSHTHSFFVLVLWFTIPLLIGYYACHFTSYQQLISWSKVTTSLQHCHSDLFPDLSLLFPALPLPRAGFLLRTNFRALCFYYLCAFIISLLCFFISCI